jgi:hypothetical protein
MVGMCRVGQKRPFQHGLNVLLLENSVSACLEQVLVTNVCFSMHGLKSI